MSQRHLPLRRAVAVTTASLLLCGITSTLAIGGPASAAVSGPDWTVTPVAGGFEVSLDLTEPLPMIDDAPTLTADGVDLGPATTSPDGLTLSVLTSDPAVADVADVEQGWASGDRAKVEPSNSAVTSTDERVQPAKKITQKQLTAAAKADGSAAGTYQYRQDDYDYGDQTIDLAGMTRALRGELTGRIYLPTTGGPRPTVVLLHGRHSACASIPGVAGTTTTWPCTAPRQTEVPSYKGYDGTAQTLASQGYAVVSISADAINAYDGSYGPDAGAVARGQLVLDSLAMIKKWNAGDPAVYHDDAKGTDLTIEGALDAPQADVGTADLNQLDAANLVGRFDLDDVGLMGHSRGGEGVATAVNLNQALDQPFGIKSVLPLAPIDFTRMTVSDVPMLVMLPYCDGDVSNQQGQHFSDDSRYNHDDSVLRSTVYVMGANHNFFNTVWTPGKYAYSTSDDWGSTSTDSVCGPASATNTRLSADDQYNVGTEYMSAWFRLTLGGEDDFLPMFDGTTKPTLSKTPKADVRVIATAPSEDRADIETFTDFTSSVRTVGSTTAAVCASAGGRTLLQEKPACATASTVRSTSAMPHWTPANYAPNVPASPMLKWLWTSASGDTAGSVRVTVPAAARNAAAYGTLSFKTAPDESVLSGTDMTVTVVDGAGAQWTSPVSALNPLAVKRMPASTSTTLNKIVLQQVSIPVASMTTINTSDIREVQFTAGGTAGLGADNTQAGGAYLSDLALSRSSIGTPVVEKGAPTINVDPTTAEEGAGPGTKSVAVVLSKASTTATSAWFTVVGSTATGSKAGSVGSKITFAPGQTCQAVTVPTFGDRAGSVAASVSYKTEVSDNAGVVWGRGAVGSLVVREDDGTVSPAPTMQVPVPPAPVAEAVPVGAQGDVCTEYAAKSQTFPLTASTTTPAPATIVTVTGTGFRAGESVTFTDSSTTPATTVGTVVANSTGTASATLLVQADAVLGARTITAVGAGSARTAKVNLTVQVPATTPSGTTSPAAPATTAPATPAAPAVKVPAAVTVKLVRVSKIGSATKVKAKIKVTGALAASPTGTVLVKLGRSSKLVSVPASGIVKVTLKRTGSQPKKVLVTYGGDTAYAAASGSSAKR